MSNPSGISNHPDPSREFDVVIVGAGPAGLALGHELQERTRRLRFCLLERGESPGESWRRMPARLKLVSPWKSSRLPGDPLRPWSAHREVTRAEFFDYLNDYASAHQLPVRPQTEVRAVRRRPGGVFDIETATETLTSRRVVNATGYFQNPFVPPRSTRGPESGPPAGRAYLELHSAHYRDPEDLARQLGKPGGLILIVGHRLTAGQLLVELTDAGFTVALSHRAPLRFASGPAGQWIFFRFLPWIEAARLRRDGPAARGFEVRMPGGKARRLIETGIVQRYPAVAESHSDAVVFANGATLKPDVVLFATGFRPAVHHLRRLIPTLHPDTLCPATNEFQSIDTPGLYFLGLDHLRNFQSRFLRGIRNDAANLAAMLTNDLNGRA